MSLPLQGRSSFAICFLFAVQLPAWAFGSDLKIYDEEDEIGGIANADLADTNHMHH